MMRILWCLVACWFLWGNFNLEIAIAKQVDLQASPPVIACFSGGREILRKNITSGPLADEYKFAHEIKVKDDKGEHSLNFSGGLCIIDRGAVTVRKQQPLSDQLSCYSGRDNLITFQVYGRETTVDEYIEGRTFYATAAGTAFNANSLHEYLVFGSEPCIGEEMR